MKYLSRMNEICEIRSYARIFPYLKHLKAIGHSFETITKPLNKKIGETLCEGLKSVFKHFEIDG